MEDVLRSTQDEASGNLLSREKQTWHGVFACCVSARRDASPPRGVAGKGGRREVLRASSANATLRGRKRLIIQRLRGPIPPLATVSCQKSSMPPSLSSSSLPPYLCQFAGPFCRQLRHGIVRLPVPRRLDGTGVPASRGVGWEERAGPDLVSGRGVETTGSSPATTA